MRALTLALCLALLACGLEESSPVPQPVPQFLRRSTPSMDQLSTLVVGLPGAVGGTGTVRARRVGAAADQASPSSDRGSFSLAIEAGMTDRIELRFETASGQSEPVLLDPPLATFGPFLRGSRGPGPVSAPDPSGQVRVSNDAGAGQPPLLDASASSELLVSNARTGEVVSTRTDAAGVFTTQLAGRTGDTIRLLLTDATDPGATSDFLSFTVP